MAMVGLDTPRSDRRRRVPNRILRNAPGPKCAFTRQSDYRFVRWAKHGVPARANQAQARTCDTDPSYCEQQLAAGKWDCRVRYRCLDSTIWLCSSTVSVSMRSANCLEVSVN